jgi:hypothetical protein
MRIKLGKNIEEASHEKQAINCPLGLLKGKKENIC